MIPRDNVPTLLLDDLNALVGIAGFQESVVRNAVPNDIAQAGSQLASSLTEHVNRLLKSNDVFMNTGKESELHNNGLALVV